MSKIAIIGARGFVGSYLTNHLNDVIPILRSDFNILDRNSFLAFVINVKPKIIINCVSFGNKTPHDTNHQDLANNLIWYNILKEASEYVDGIINIGSGAEFDMTKEISFANERLIFDRTPSSSYGLAKNLIARDITYQEKFCTLRLFGCFGPRELDSRLFKRYISSKEFYLNNRLFDYFSIQDFTSVVDTIVNNKIFNGTDINCVYEEKLFLDEILLLFKNIKGYNIPVVVEKQGLSYTGSCKNLNQLNVPLIGLEKGIELWQE
ncbi:NAD-dependent epimerase/dehydratase family protein [bacterium]|nr:NAD-dependent epimerase/dehydratase family protein [bacterium]